MSDFLLKTRHWSRYRQYLDRRGNNANEVLEAVIGVYSAHPSGPLSLWTRMENFEEAMLVDLEANRQAFRLPVMRQSVYLLPAKSAWTIRAASLPAPEDPAWERRYSQKGRAIPKDLYPGWTKVLLQACREPQNAKDLKQAVPDIPPELFKMVLNRMAFENKLLRIGSTSLRSNIISYVNTVAWTGKAAPFPNSRQSLHWLATAYFQAFGPARMKDFQWWVGITGTQAKEAIHSISLCRLDGEYLLNEGDQKAFEAFKVPETKSIDILPQWDCYTMGYAPDGRERFVEHTFLNQVYGKLGATGGNALGTILINGLAHGSWSSRFRGKKMEVTLNLFKKVSAGDQNRIEQKFEEIAKLLQAKTVNFVV